MRWLSCGVGEPRNNATGQRANLRKSPERTLDSSRSRLAARVPPSNALSVFTRSNSRLSEWTAAA